MRILCVSQKQMYPAMFVLRTISTPGLQVLLFVHSDTSGLMRCMSKTTRVAFDGRSGAADASLAIFVVPCLQHACKRRVV